MSQGIVIAKRGESQTTFTKDQWDMLGSDKAGWVKVKNEPAEVTELKNANNLKARSTYIYGLGLEGLLTDAELTSIPDEHWPTVETVLNAIQQRVGAHVNYRVSQALGANKAPVQIPEKQPVENPVNTPAVGEAVNEAAAKAVQNEPTAKVITDDYTGMQSGNFVAPPVRTNVLADDLSDDNDDLNAANSEGPAQGLNPSLEGEATRSVIDTSDVPAAIPEGVPTTVGTSPATGKEGTPVKNKGGRPPKTAVDETKE